MNESEYGRNKTFPILLLVVALVAIGGAVYWMLLRNKPKTEPTVLPPAPVAEVAPEIALPPDPAPPGDTEAAAPLVEAPRQSPEPAGKLPPLDRSDAVVLSYLLESSEGSFQSWLIEDHLIRKFVRAVNALEEGKLVSQYRPFQDPQTPFSAANNGEAWSISAENYARYTPYLESLEKVGPEKLLQMYERYYPLLEQAYEELGVRKGDFREVTIRALTRIVKAPAPPPDATLARPSVAYRFSTAELEQRSAVEKLLFRIGPENTQRLKKLAQDLLDQLQ